MARQSDDGYTAEPKVESTVPPPHSSSGRTGDGLPIYNHNGHKVTRGIHPDGESGRKGIHPLHFLRICFRSTSTASKFVNFLWPFVPAAIAIVRQDLFLYIVKLEKRANYDFLQHFARPDLHLWIFILNYIAMVPAANLIGFAGQELARKLRKVFGVIIETTLGSVVEIVLFMVLISKGNDSVPVIRAAILGSILANLLLCLGMCFFVGGIRREDQEFHEAISEVGSGLILVAGSKFQLCLFFTSSLLGKFLLTITQRVLLYLQPFPMLLAAIMSMWSLRFSKSVAQPPSSCYSPTSYMSGSRQKPTTVFMVKFWKPTSKRMKIAPKIWLKTSSHSRNALSHWPLHSHVCR